MLSKSELKELKSLHQKKYRDKVGSFLVEGDKSVREAIKSNASIKMVFALENWNGNEYCLKNGTQLQTISPRDLVQLCELKNPKDAVALIDLPKSRSDLTTLKGKWHIYLDRVQDPGNLGTILRIADWYGMDTVICSPECVEQYNQKVIQASMGAVFRIAVIIMDNLELIKIAKKEEVPLYAAVMNGASIHDTNASSSGILLMGNEGNGLSNELLASSEKRISIPGAGEAESLNVAIAAGILSDWVYRSSSR